MRRGMLLMGIGLLVLATPLAAQTPTGTAFTFQGRLDDAGAPANGIFDLQFVLFDAGVGGSQVSETLPAVFDDVAVTDGLFTVSLDYGTTGFGNDARWLEVGVRPGASTGGYTTLSPRHELKPAPYSMVSQRVPWTGVVNTPAGLADGDDEGVVTVNAGDGLTGGGTGASVTLDVDLGTNGSSTSVARMDHDHFGQIWGGSASGLSVISDTSYGLFGLASSPTGNFAGVQGRSSSTSGVGVFGEATSPSGIGTGVHGVSVAFIGMLGEGPRGVVGETSWQFGTGVQGVALAASGPAYGVSGTSQSTSGTGVQGRVSATTGPTTGVYGTVNSTDGTGVWGHASRATGTTRGVRGTASSDTGTGVYGEATSTSGATFGVVGTSAASFGAGVSGVASAASGPADGVRGSSTSTGGSGVRGDATATTGFTDGVLGVSYSSDGTGVSGSAVSTTGTTWGVKGGAVSSSGTGVLGQGTTGVHGESSSSSGQGVFGEAIDPSGFTIGVRGNASSPNGTAVLGRNTATTGLAMGLFGITDSTSGRAVSGDAEATSGITYGVHGFAASPNGFGGFFANSGGGNLIAANDTTSAVDLEFRVDSGGNVYADGTYYGAGGVSVGSADFAEMVLPGQTDLEPGDVLVIGPDGLMARSSAAFDTAVVGVHSTEPGFIAGNKIDEDGNPLEPERIPLAMVGFVPVRASAENGPIAPGDLLVSSSVPGHAMHGGDAAPQGSVIGKAMGRLESGTGVIEMVVVLQ